MRKNRYKEEWGEAWSATVGALAVAAAGAIVVATIVEDVATGGAGIADDPASFAAAGASASFGINLLRAALGF